MLDQENQAAIVNQFSYATEAMSNSARNIEINLSQPHILLRPKMFRDGNQWCCLYGDSLQEGVCGFGDSPYQAAMAFDGEWHKKIHQA